MVSYIQFWNLGDLVRDLLNLPEQPVASCSASSGISSINSVAVFQQIFCKPLQTECIPTKAVWFSLFVF